MIPTADWKKKRTGVPWQRGETLSVAIGQGYDLATPLQMAVLISAIANGGIRYRPSIVKEIRTAQEEVLQGAETQVVDRVKISKETLSLVRQGLWEVVNTKGGTARIARVKGLAYQRKNRHGPDRWAQKKRAQGQGRGPAVASAGPRLVCRLCPVGPAVHRGVRHRRARRTRFKRRSADRQGVDQILSGTRNDLTGNDLDV